MIKFDEFKKLDMRVAVIKEAKEHPNADKLLILTIDIGGEKREVVAGIKNFYKADELIGKRVIALVNMEPATIRGVESCGMVLAAKDADTLGLLIPERGVKIGSKVS